MGQSHLVTKLRNMLRFILLVFCLSYVTAEPYSGPLASIENRGGQATVVEHHSPYGYAKSGEYVAVNPGAVHHAKRSVYTLPTLSISYQGGVPTTEGRHTPYGYDKSGEYVAVNPGAVHYAKRSPWTGQCFNYLGEAVKCSTGVSPALPTLSISQGGVPAIEGRHTPSGYASAGKYVGVSDGVVHYAKRSVDKLPTLAITYQGGVPTTVGRHTPYGYAKSGEYVAVNPGAVHYAKRSTWTGECFNYL